MKEIYLALIVLCANIVEAISGFGSTIISVTLGSGIYDIDKLISILLPINIILSTYIVSRHHKFIRFSMLIKEIFPFMGSGLLLGIVILNLFSVSVLKNIYGTLVVLLAVKELYILLISKITEKKNLSSMLSGIFIFMAGIVHGLYASGGPLLVYGISSKNLDKDSFRVNLSMIWLVFNLILFSVYLISGKVNIDNLKISAYLLPTLLVGVFIGEKIHHRINEKIFRTGVFSILFIAGIRLAISK